jgi:histidinol-phosphate aminotransferase|tara:strand:+ start:8461 stop:9555 length:1095 start_codon:yes stop_codon:yes gene_type:complete
MIEKLVRKEAAEVLEYIPGMGKDDLSKRYGLDLKKIIKLGSNENSLGPSPKAIDEIKKSSNIVHLYPNENAFELRRNIAENLDLKLENIILGNGSDEIIELIIKAFLNKGEEAIIPSPTFSLYASLVKLHSGKVIEIPLTKEFGYNTEKVLKKINQRTKMIFLCSPNNPTGGCVALKNVLKLLEQKVLVILDEAYIEYANQSNVNLINEYENLIVLRTFSKAFGLAGLRVGYGVANKKTIKYLVKVKPPFNVNILAQKGAIGALKDSDHLKKTIRSVHDGRDFLTKELRKIRGLKVYPSHANFLLINVKGTNMASSDIAENLLKRGIIIRDCNSFGLGDEYLRISVGKAEENHSLIKTLKKVLN